MGFYGGLMGSTGIYPLVNVYITMEKSPFFMGKSAISMAMFDSYVKLPEGTWQMCAPIIPTKCHANSLVELTYIAHHVEPT